MKTRKMLRVRRKFSIRKKIRGSASRPRLSVFRSHARMYAQFINDDVTQTIASAYVTGKTMQDAKKLGESCAQLAKKHHIQSVVFDRNGFRYHGVIKVFADTLRSEGITL